MQISITHSTTYRYEFPVYFEPHVFSLRPRMSSAQRLLSFKIQIAPTPAGSTECLDQDGNLALNAWFAAPSINLSVLSRFTVELLRVNPFDYVLKGESFESSIGVSGTVMHALTPYRNHAHFAESVKRFAQSAALAAQADVLWFLTALSLQIWQTFGQVTHPDGAPWASDRTLDSGEGSCRNLACWSAMSAGRWGWIQGSSVDMKPRPRAHGNRTCAHGRRCSR